MEPKWLLAIFLISFCIMIPTNLSLALGQNLGRTRNLRALIFYNSGSVVSAYQFQEMLNQSMLVELWDVTASPFPNDVAVLRNSSLVVLDGGIDYSDLDSDQRTAIWSALYVGTHIRSFQKVFTEAKLCFTSLLEMIQHTLVYKTSNRIF